MSSPPAKTDWNNRASKERVTIANSRIAAQERYPPSKDLTTSSSKVGVSVSVCTCGNTCIL
ncbi:MAG: hypothetical protein R2795_05595 [Saprospiraceae bacterium]